MMRSPGHTTSGDWRKDILREDISCDLTLFDARVINLELISATAENLSVVFYISIMSPMYSVHYVFDILLLACFLWSSPRTGSFPARSRLQVFLFYFWAFGHLDFLMTYTLFRLYIYTPLRFVYTFSRFLQAGALDISLKPRKGGCSLFNG